MLLVGNTDRKKHLPYITVELSLNWIAFVFQWVSPSLCRPVKAGIQPCHLVSLSEGCFFFFLQINNSFSEKNSERIHACSSHKILQLVCHCHGTVGYFFVLEESIGFFEVVVHWLLLLPASSRLFSLHDTQALTRDVTDPSSVIYFRCQ